MQVHLELLNLCEGVYSEGRVSRGYLLTREVCASTFSSIDKNNGIY